MIIENIIREKKVEIIMEVLTVWKVHLAKNQSIRVQVNWLKVNYLVPYQKRQGNKEMIKH